MTIKNSTLQELQSTDDQYKCIGINTVHLSENDIKYLEQCAENDKSITIGKTDFAFVTSRQEGFFIKCYSDEYQEFSPELDLPCDELFNIVKVAILAGFHMIEFDCDATVYDTLSTF